jgi:hypothetical protein
MACPHAVPRPQTYTNFGLGLLQNGRVCGARSVCGWPPGLICRLRGHQRTQSVRLRSTVGGGLTSPPYRLQT